MLYEVITRDEFSLHYQPQYDIHDGRLIGAEALLRWYSPDFDAFLGFLQESFPNVHANTEQVMMASYNFV